MKSLRGRGAVFAIDRARRYWCGGKVVPAGWAIVLRRGWHGQCGGKRTQTKGELRSTAQTEVCATVRVWVARLIGLVRLLHLRICHLVPIRMGLLRLFS